LQINSRTESLGGSPKQRFGILTYILTSITKHRWRTILTVIGIAVPIAFFILFAAMSEGLNQYILEQELENSANKENYEEMSKIVNAWTNVMLVIIAIMIIIIITNTILMSTSERKFELGVLKAIGISSDQILYLVLLEAFVISFIALIVGIIMGAWGAILFDYMFYLDEGAGFFFAPAKITINSIIFTAVLTLILGTVTATYPAIKASKLNIIDILRYE
jgi:ABC-type antimicrobial peptide transport system permease subunit